MLQYLLILLVIPGIQAESSVSLWNMIFGGGQNKSVNNLKQEAFNVSEVENPNNYNQMQHLGSSEESPEGLFGKNSTAFLDRQYERMGLADMGVNKDDFMSNIYNFAQNTRGMESDNNPLAASKKSTAKGVYQFTDDSVDTGRQRMLNMGFDPEMARNISQDPREWSDEEADSMFLANIFAQRGSDDYLYRVGMGEAGADREAYYKFHHTNPDQATMDRAPEFFSGTPQDELMDSYAKTNSGFNY